MAAAPECASTPGTDAPSVVFRADASAALGSGHIVRCASLARALISAGARCSFVCRPTEGHLLDWLASQGLEAVGLPAGTAHTDPGFLEDATATADAVRRSVGRADWLVVDHYSLDATWERQLRSVACRIAALDDLADRPHAVDLLIDPNLQSGQQRYASVTDAGCQQLLGVRYALLRPEFVATAAEPPRTRSPRVERLLACVGGTDPQNVLPVIVAAWKRLAEPRPRLDIAVGPGTANADALRQLCGTLPDVHLHMPAHDMAKLMASADLMVCSAGSISWERCCVGTPALMVTTAGNQADNLRALVRQRAGISLGSSADLNAPALAALLERLRIRTRLLQRIGRRARGLVDGHGARRVASLMLRDRLTLRAAVAADAEMVWPWRNHPATRRHFFDPRPVPLDSHLAWWSAAVSDPQKSLLIATIGNNAVGVMRLDHGLHTSTVSIYLDPLLSGLRIGERLLAATQSWTTRHREGCLVLRAEILPDNRQSIRCFESAGFVHVDGAWIWARPTSATST
jgi:UDP-2,4-diacetamido-2,4,6-trideoxy-beta-L-altropyranose hydrolase